MRQFILSILIGACLCSSQPSIGAGDPITVAAQRKAMGRQAQVVPRSKEPVGKITVLSMWPEDNPTKIAIAALQGIVNRDKPQLYIGIDKPLRWLEYHGGKIVIEPTEPDIFKVFDQFKDSVKGIVVYDDSIDALANVAITYAGIEDLIPADAKLAETLSSKFGWKVVHDLRGQWKTRIEAYEWAYQNLFPKCSKIALTHYNHGFRLYDAALAPNSETGKTGYAVDYCVEFRMFCWHTPKQFTPEEMAFSEKVMESVPFFTPVFGRSSTQETYDEPAFVSFCAQFGNLHIPAGMGNTSVLSGAQISPDLLKQKPLPVTRDKGPNKIYVAFTNSEHDNLEHVIGGGHYTHRGTMETDDPYRIWWSDPWRGRVPIGWPIGPLIADLAPTTLAQFMTTKTDNDYFLAALSGLCLSDPQNFGAQYPDIQDEMLDEYCKMTGDYMNRLGWTQAQPVGPPSILRHFIKNIPGMTGVMEGYGPHKGMTPEKANYMLDGVPVFHALTEGTFGTGRSHPIGEENPRKAKAYAEEIKAIKITGRPGFIHAWNVGWDFGPTTLKMTADLLPPEYVVVRPDELAALYKKYKGTKKPPATAKPATAVSGIVKETPGADGLIVDTGKIKVEIGWGQNPQPPVKRIMGVDGKWRCSGMLYANNPKKLAVKTFTTQKTKDTPAEKEYLLTYSYDENNFENIRIHAYAGRPYVVIEEKSKGADLPSWTISPYDNFQPDTYTNDAFTLPLTYKSQSAMGGFPWYRWAVTSKQNAPDRDMIGIVSASWEDWTAAEILFWQRPNAGFFEFYSSRSGYRKYAIASLDKNDAGAPKRIWEELNGK